MWGYTQSPLRLRVVALVLIQEQLYVRKSRKGGSTHCVFHGTSLGMMRRMKTVTECVRLRSITIQTWDSMNGNHARINGTNILQSDIPGNNKELNRNCNCLTDIHIKRLSLSLDSNLPHISLCTSTSNLNRWNTNWMPCNDFPFYIYNPGSLIHDTRIRRPCSS
jgi:hypothetical protein